MPALSAEDATALARQYRDWAKVVGDAMLGPVADLGADGLLRLKALHDQLLAFSMQFAADGVTIACDDLGPHLTALENATGRLDAAMRRVQEVDSLLESAAKAVALAGAIAAGDVTAIGTAAASIG